MINIFRKKKRFENTANMVNAVENFIKHNLMKVNISNYEVHLSKELIWDGKSEKWKANMVLNIHHYIGLKRALNDKDHKDLPIKIRDILNKQLILEKKING
jgi:hypothetical protein